DMQHGVEAGPDLLGGGIVEIDPEHQAPLAPHESERLDFQVAPDEPAVAEYERVDHAHRAAWRKDRRLPRLEGGKRRVAGAERLPRGRRRWWPPRAGRRPAKSVSRLERRRPRRRWGAVVGRRPKRARPANEPFPSKETISKTAPRPGPGAFPRH